MKPDLTGVAALRNAAGGDILVTELAEACSSLGA